MIKVTALQDQVIRINGASEKTLVKKGKTVEIREEDMSLFLSNNFVRATDNVSKNQIQTTDASTEKRIAKR